MVKWSEKFYKPIRQRHKWGEKQEIPETDTIGLYYDLFFVGVAYNLGHMVKDEKASSVSILYLIGLYLPCSYIWYNKMIFNARFEQKGCLYRRVLFLIDVLLIATATLHIDTLETLRNTENVHMFAYCIAVTLTMPVNCISYLEIYFYKNISPEAKKTALTELTKMIIPFALFLAATISSGSGHFAAKTTESDTRDLEQHYNEVYANENRKLQNIEADGVINDFPVILCLCAYFGDLFFAVVNVCSLIGRPGEEKKKFIVPLNYEYAVSSTVKGYFQIFIHGIFNHKDNFVMLRLIELKIG